MSKQRVIIGSGVSGLLCGAVLAKNGYEITVLEQGGQIGGCLQCFSHLHGLCCVPVKAINTCEVF